jgi:hypothetical protein
MPSAVTWTHKFADWTPITVYPKVLRLVSRINTKILVGNGLDRNEEWIDISASVSQVSRKQPFPSYTNTCITVYKKYLRIVCKASDLSPSDASSGSILHPRTPPSLAL